MSLLQRALQTAVGNGVAEAVVNKASITIRQTKAERNFMCFVEKMSEFFFLFFIKNWKSERFYFGRKFCCFNNFLFLQNEFFFFFV